MDHRSTLEREKLIMARLLFLLFLGFLQSAAWGQQHETLGRLFFTPHQRAMLDRNRQLNANFNSGAMLNEGRLTLNGEVRRSEGHGTHWINGEATPSETMATPPIPVGDTLLPRSGGKESLLGSGTIIIKPPHTSP